jgi:hypothetical protein
MQASRAVDSFLSYDGRPARWRASVAARRPEFGWDLQAVRLRSVSRPMRPLASSPEAAA